MIFDMGELTDSKPVKLITSIIYRDDKLLAESEAFLVKEYGEKEDLEATFPFDQTGYYEKEFGKDLKRKLLCFRGLITLDSSGKIKVFTNDVERTLSLVGRRRVNIDPGYVTEAKVVLLTTKDYSHRVYVGDKIFAEVTLYFQNGSFRPWPWSYPDYASNELVGYFNDVRARYREDLKRIKKSR